MSISIWYWVLWISSGRWQNPGGAGMWSQEKNALWGLYGDGQEVSFNSIWFSEYLSYLLSTSSTLDKPALCPCICTYKLNLACWLVSPSSQPAVSAAPMYPISIFFSLFWLLYLGPSHQFPTPLSSLSTLKANRGKPPRVPTLTLIPTCVFAWMLCFSLPMFLAMANPTIRALHPIPTPTQL